MTKVLVVGLMLAGAYFLLQRFFPAAFVEGVNIQGHQFMWVFFILCLVGFIGYKVKA